MYDAIVIGGGPAGLQAALTLGRMHRRALLVDSGDYRNAAATHMHNIAGNDGTPPAEFRATVRRELTAYDSVEVRDGQVERVCGRDGDFIVTLTSREALGARKIVLATGVRDVLPDVPGIAELWGDLVHHCPFCHGHELAGQRIGIQEGPHAQMLLPMLGAISDSVTIIRGLESVSRDGDALKAVTTDGVVVLDGLFAAVPFEQSAPFAQQLGLDLHESGCIAVDIFGQTSAPGVLAAGDLAHHADLPMPMASVLVAAAAGQVAGSVAAREVALG